MKRDKYFTFNIDNLYILWVLKPDMSVQFYGCECCNGSSWLSPIDLMTNEEIRQITAKEARSLFPILVKEKNEKR